MFDFFEKQDILKKKNINNFPDWVLNYYVSNNRQRRIVQYETKLNNVDKYYILTYFVELKNIKKIIFLFALKTLPTDITRIIYNQVQQHKEEKIFYLLF